MWQTQLLEYVGYLRETLPLPLFAFAGSLFEEIVSPIPSSVIQIGVGGLAQGQSYPWYGVVMLSLIGASGNTLGAIIPYTIYRLVGVSLVKVIGKYVGLTPERVSAARGFLQRGARDDVVIFLLRALPFVPILNPSVICGILGIKVSTFVIATFLGYAVRNGYMLTVGFVGIEAVKRGDPRAIGLLVLIGIIVGIMVFISHRHNQRATKPDQSVDEA